MERILHCTQLPNHYEAVRQHHSCTPVQPTTPKLPTVQGQDRVLKRIPSLNRLHFSRLCTRRGGWKAPKRPLDKEAKVSKLAADQLAALAEIKRTVRRWIDGEIGELPPSTCRHLASKEDPR